MAQEITMKKSKMSHSNYELGLFPARTVGKGENVPYHFVSPLLADLTMKQQLMNTYDDEEMYMTSETFQI